MELDVHLKRDGDESWGFRLIGGKDFNMPLTVVKIVPQSPADKAGLQNGDAVCRINDQDASDLSHDNAKKAVDATADTLVLGVNRGLYDPVLDDYEPLYEPIDQEDFDQPSQPTEVDPFAIQQFTDQNLPATLPELRDIETLFTNGADLQSRLCGTETPFTDLQSRSLTASPFVLPTKPYRPFSTEPLPVPPLEDPIILNPYYKDQFGKLKDGEVLPETKFKLPISEQYDPDGKKKKEKESKTSKEMSCSDSNMRKDVTFEERAVKETKISEEMQHKVIVDEVKFMEKMKKEIDLDHIEMTAVSLVNESIERAVTVANEIKKEIDVALSESVVSSETKQSTTVTKSVVSKETTASSNVSKEKTKEATELVNLIDKTTEEIISYNGSKSDVCVAKVVEKFKNYENKQKVVEDIERRLSTKKEIEESIVLGSVRRKSEAFDIIAEDISVDAEQNVEKKKRSESKVNNKVTAEKYVNEKAVKSESAKQTAQKESEMKNDTTSTTQKTAVKTDATTKKHRAYTIGLQTIPNIKGTIHSSYHYNLLLKTFFIHLTDVMVALSRFILTEPVFDKEETEVKKDVTTSETLTQRVDIQDEHLTETVVKERKAEFERVAKEEKYIKEEIEKQEEKKTLEQKIDAKKQELSTETTAKEDKLKVIEFGKAEDVKEYLQVEEALETRMLSGAKMAQLTERKSEELTQRMDAVITEFETKAGIEASAELRERRSRSRSRIEEEVAKESDPLEWLSKVDKQTQEIAQVKTETKSFSSTAESVEKKRTEIEKLEPKTSETKEGKQMYVAIIESHVFTNKDAIFEEKVAEFSQTSSLQSADKINTALQASEVVATEKITVETKDIQTEVAETILEEARELAIVNACCNTVDVKQDENAVKESHSESIVCNAAVQETIAPVVKEEIKTTLSEDAQKVDIKGEEHSVVSQKTEYIVEEAEHESVQEKKDQTVSIIEVSNVEIETEPIKVEEQKIKQVEEEKASEVISTEIKIVQPARLTPTRDEAAAELKIIKEEVLEVEQTLQLTEDSELLVNNHTEAMESENQYTFSRKNIMESYESNEVVQESSFTAKTSSQSKSVTMQLDSIEQESSFTAITSEQSKKLTLQLDLAEQRSQTSLTSDPPSTIDTPTPATVPPTPLTDEYVFKLHIPLPKNTGDPIPRDCTPTPEDEDPHIVKKKLIPHIETTLDSPIIYDPPLPTRTEDKVQSPVYTKPGLRGGSDRREFRRGGGKKKEEILEIERRSTLLASAIDETIKCIEEYKEEVGIDTKKEVNLEEMTNIETSSKILEEKTFKQENNVSNGPIIYNGYAKVETKIYDTIQKDNKIDDEWNHIDKQVNDSNEKLQELSCRVNGNVKEIIIDTKNETFQESKVTDLSVEEPSATIEVESLKDNQLNGFELHEIPSSIAESGASETTPEVIAVIEPPSALFKVEEKRDPLDGYRPIQFDPEELKTTKKNLQNVHLSLQGTTQRAVSPSYMGPNGELLGTHQGIVDGLEEAVVEPEVASKPQIQISLDINLDLEPIEMLEKAEGEELGKPGMTEEKIAELISGESEMLREAHVMGLSRVLKSHMHRADDGSSVDFKKIKPIIESLKDSEVLKALNDELLRTQEEKKKKEEEKKWTTFLQKPKRPVPRAKFGYYGYIEPEVQVEEPYKVKIVKQPKPKVAPDYKPEDFETGPLPWEERAMNEPSPPPVNPEDPILIPEEVPEFLEAVDPLPESEVPDLEETGISLPSPKPVEETEPSPVLEAEEEEDTEEQPEELDIDAVVEETERIVEEMEQNRLAEQLLSGVQSMVDPNASIDQQLAQMRAQLAALAQLPNVIQQTLDLVTRQLSQLSHQETQQMSVSQTQSHMENVEENQESVDITEVQTNGDAEEPQESHQEQADETKVEEVPIIEEQTKPTLTEEEREKLKREEEEMLEEQKRIEKQKKEIMEQMRLEQESRQVKQRPTPRVGKPKPVFGPPQPVERPLVLPGGRKWRKPADAYNEQFIAETLSAQAEIIQGKAKGSFESDILPYDERINFMKYEKPPVSLDHLQNSETYKLIHNMEAMPAKRVEMRTPVIAEVDYREKCRSVTPAHMNMPQQVHP